jgi:hypothetical protein
LLKYIAPSCTDDPNQDKCIKTCEENSNQAKCPCSEWRDKAGTNGVKKVGCPAPPAPNPTPNTPIAPVVITCEVDSTQAKCVTELETDYKCSTDFTLKRNAKCPMYTCKTQMDQAKCDCSYNPA